MISPWGHDAEELQEPDQVTPDHARELKEAAFPDKEALGHLTLESAYVQFRHYYIFSRNTTHAVFGFSAMFTQ